MGRRPLFAGDAPLIDLSSGNFSSNPAASRLATGLVMLDTMEIALFAGLGLLFAAGLAALSRWSQTRPARLAAFALIAVCFFYVGFAIRSEEPAAWIGFEMTGVAVFGTLAGMSLIGSPWFVVVGLLLHPVWALYVHYTGAGSEFAPAPFVIANAAFDVATGLYVAFMAVRMRGEANPQSATPGRKVAARSQHRKGGAS